MSFSQPASLWCPADGVPARPALCPPQRKIYEMKAKFNEEFDRLKKQKHSDTDKISDINSKITDVNRELVKLGAPRADDKFAPKVVPHEDMDSVLKVRRPALWLFSAPLVSQYLGPLAPCCKGTVPVVIVQCHGDNDVSAMDGSCRCSCRCKSHPFSSPTADYSNSGCTIARCPSQVQESEIKSEAYVSPEERARLDAEHAAELERLAEAARNNVYERALREMMNGTLDNADDDKEEAGELLGTVRSKDLITGQTTMCASAI